MNFYSSYFKTIFDVIFVLFTSFITIPIIISISILIFLKEGSPIFFKQVRTGSDMRPFKIIKFRTMTNKNRNGEFNCVDVTKLGAFLRKTSLDELPSLLNVLKGDMSLIGPRPYLHSYINGYSEEQKKRFLLKPGLSGLLQVKQRNNCTWSTKFRYDRVYLDNCSFVFDLYIIFLTVYVILRPKENISGKGSTLFYQDKS